MSGDLKFGILGGAGRMGQMNIRQISMTDGCVLAGATGRPGSDVVGQMPVRWRALDRLGSPLRMIQLR